MRAICSLTPSLLVLALAGSVAAAEAPEAALLAVLASSAAVHEKARACQQLAVVGSPAAIPALAALLDNDPLADYARSGLEAIPDPAAAEALRKALSRLDGRLLAGVVNSLGVRRDTAAVADLQQLALDPQRGVAAEALASLGMIGTIEAAKILDTALTTGSAGLRVPAAHAALTAATQLAETGNSAAARELLGDIIRTLPAGHLTAAAQRQLAALPAK
ncbi:MAG: HEAT repeat domain-containing protein [Verrucomicrobiota bacterium]